MKLPRIARFIALLSAVLVGLSTVPDRSEAHTLGEVRRVSRRTSRRTAVRHNLYTLPAGYTTVVRSGVTYYVVDGAYYSKVIQGGQVTYVVVDL